MEGKKQLVSRQLKMIRQMIATVIVAALALSETPLTAKADDVTGFVSGAVIESDTAPEYCWGDSTVNLKVQVYKGTNVKWEMSGDTSNVSFDVQGDMDSTAGRVYKAIDVRFGSSARGAVTFKAVASNGDSRTITLNVRNSLSEIYSGSDFTNQYTDTTFEVSAVVDARYANNITWYSNDSAVKIKASDKNNSFKYAGSVIKYAQVTIDSAKPASGKAIISAIANNVSRQQEITVGKSATNIKDIKVTESSNAVDLTKYPHMSSDTIYVDMHETIKINCSVEGTLINQDVENSLFNIDDEAVIGVESNNENITISHAKTDIKSSSDYDYSFNITGLKATEKPLSLTIQTESGKVAKDYKLIVLAPATGMGLCLEEDYETFDLTNYSELSENKANIANNGVTIKDGNTIDLREIFKPQFKKTPREEYNYDTGKYETVYEYEYFCNSTDEALWSSSDTDVIAITQQGEITGLKEGSATVVCKAKETLTSPRDDFRVTYKLYVSKINLASDINIKDSNNNVISSDTIYTSTPSKKYSVNLVPKDTGTVANEDVTWESSDETVFTVDNNGTVTPKSAGTATLSATTTRTGITAKVKIEVVAAVESITLTKLTNGINGHSYLLEATVDESANQDEELTWSLNNNKAVFIDPDDAEQKELKTFTGKKCYVKIKSNSGSCEVTVRGKYLTSAVANTKIVCKEAYNADIARIVKGIDATGADFTHRTLEVTKGEKVELTSLLLHTDEDGKVIESNDEYIWEVEGNTNENGDTVLDIKTDITNKNVKTIEFTPLTKGIVTIKVRDLQTNNIVYTKIDAKVPTTSFEMEEKTLLMSPNTTYQLNYELLPFDTTDIVTFTTSNEDIVEVDDKGLLTSYGSSTEKVIITAKSNDDFVRKCVVQVVDNIGEISVVNKDTGVQLVTADVPSDVDLDEIPLPEDDECTKVYVDSTITVEAKNSLGEWIKSEPLEWKTSDEEIASLNVSADTYSCTINGNSGGIALVTVTGVLSKKSVSFFVKPRYRYAQGAIALAESWDLDYNSESGYYGIYIRNEYYDDIVWTVADPEIVAVDSTRDGSIINTTFTGLKAGTTTVTATSADGRVSDTMKVTVRPISIGYYAEAELDETDEFLYDGKEKKAEVTVTNDGTTLVEGVDYELVYSNNVEPGTATVKIIGKGNYNGEVSKSYYIGRRDIDEVTVSVSQNNVYKYGADVIPSTVKVTDLGNTLVDGTDFYTTYENNINVGTATLTITACSARYTGSKTITYKIQPANIASSKIKVAKIATQVYSGKAKKPAVEVTVKSGNPYTSNILTKNVDYKVTYSNNVKIGKTAKVKIIGRGNYTGSKTVTFTIKPKVTKPRSIKLSYNKKTNRNELKVKWSRNKLVTGYEVQYSTSYDFTTGKKTIKITKNKTTSTTVKKLKGNSYYVRMRAYKTIGGKKLYSDWSESSWVYR